MTGNWWMALSLCIALSACTQSYEARIAELDARATVDCGSVSDCDTAEDADAAIACMRENLAAGVRAKAVFILDIDPVAYVYTDGNLYRSVEGYCIDEGDCYFTESVCRELEARERCGLGRVTVTPTDCEVVQRWGDD